MQFVAGNCAFDVCRKRHPGPSEVASIKADKGAKSCKHGVSCETKGCLYLHSPPSSGGREIALRRATKAAKAESLRRRKMAIEHMMQKLKAASVVDLCIVVDCTGSMHTYIAKVKEELFAMVDSIRAKHPDVVLNIAFVGYRDHEYGADRIIHLDFTSDIQAMQTAIAGVKTNIKVRGGDWCEDVLGGLDAVAALSWSSTTRLLFHVGDMPCHGTQFLPPADIRAGKSSGRPWDNYPGEEPHGLDAGKLLKRLVATLNIRYYFGRLTSYTDRMIEEFNKMLLASGVPHGSEVAQVGLDSADELVWAILKSVTASIEVTEQQTITAEVAATGPKRAPKEYTIVEDEPDWTTVREEEINRISYKMPNSIASLSLDRDWKLREKTGRRKIQISEHPFSKGADRLAFYGVEVAYQASATRGHIVNSGLSEGNQVVLKEYIDSGKGVNTLANYMQEMEIQTVAAFLAQEFNRACAAAGGVGSAATALRFIKCHVAHLTDRDRPVYFGMETRLRGASYEKFSNNFGYTSAAFSETLGAFSHYTYSVTDGEIMVVDLQGVSDKEADRYYLTDPVIHCISERFGKQNMLRTGMKRFFQTHECGPLCHALGLTDDRIAMDMPE
jgi:hypothetical protein